MDRAPLEQLLEQGLSLAEIGRRFGDTKRLSPTGSRSTGLVLRITPSISRVAGWDASDWRP